MSDFIFHHKLLKCNTTYIYTFRRLSHSPLNFRDRNHSKTGLGNLFWLMLSHQKMFHFFLPKSIHWYYKRLSFYELPFLSATTSYMGYSLLFHKLEVPWLLCALNNLTLKQGSVTGMFNFTGVVLYTSHFEIWQPYTTHAIYYSFEWTFHVNRKSRQRTSRTGIKNIQTITRHFERLRGMIDIFTRDSQKPITSWQVQVHI